MNRYVSYALTLLLTLISLSGSAQDPNNSKPRQFNNFPNLISCSTSTLNGIFNSSAGQDISLSFSDDFLFNGTVTCNVVKYSNLQTAVIRSPFFNNSIFSVSRVTNKDNSVTYLGRIINKNYFDGYELKQNAAGQYQLIKMETDRVIPDCRQL